MTTLWWTLNLLAAVLLAALLATWSRERADIARRARLGAAAALAAAALASLALVLYPLPIGWITVLQEGRSLRNVQQLYGMTTHHGAGFSAVIDALSGHGPATLPAVATLNVALWAVNAVVFLFLAEAVLRVRWAALVLALTWALNLNTLHAAVSETPAMLWTTWCWAGALAVAALADPQASARLRRLACAALGAIVGVSALLRAELLLVGAPALCIALAVAAGRTAALRQAAVRAGDALRALAAGRWWILALVVAALLLVERLPWPLHLRWLIAALQPLNLSFLDLPRALGVFLPLGLLALFVLGLVYGLRHWIAFALLPVTVLVLFKLYAAAGHGVFFENFRYLTYVTPLVFLLALFGFRELSEQAARRHWPPWWRRVALLALALTFTVWRPPGALKEFFGRTQQLPGLAAPPAALLRISAPLLAWNVQTEVRYLLDLTRRHPACVFVTRTLQAESTFDGAAGHRWVAFGAPLTPYRSIADDGQDLAAAIAALAPDAPCVFFYRGLDCNLAASDGCRRALANLRPREEYALENLPYADIREYGAHTAEIRLGIYEVNGGR